MKPDKTIKIKAFILMSVFSLSTVISFACSLGLDMGYNNGHHTKKKKTAHECCEKPVSTSENQSSEEKDDCCTNSVINFQLMAKSITQNNIDFSVLFSQLHHEAIEFLIALKQFTISSEMKWAVFRSDQLPPPDIRVSIHSFQI